MDELGADNPEEIPAAGAAKVSSQKPGHRGWERAQSIALTGLFVLAICYTLYVAQDILMPVTAAVILALLLQPAVRLLRRVKIPEPIAAGVVVAALFAVLAVGIYFLSDPAAKWMSQMPDVVAQVQAKIKAPIKEINDAKEAVEDLVEKTQANTEVKPNGNAASAKKPDAAPESIAPEVARLSLIDVFSRTFAVLSGVAWGAIIIFVLLYFLLARGTILRENIIFALPTLRDKRRALAVTSDVQRNVSAYLVTVILINLGLGVAIGVAMYAVDLPNPALWGAMAAMLNFIPYLGAIAGSIVVAIVGLLTYATPVEALLPPMIYLAINSLEGYLATPAILSRRLTINPIAVFLSIIFWGWIWGIAGALMAVPILACLKVICSASERLAPVSQFLNGRRAE